MAQHAAVFFKRKVSGTGDGPAVEALAVEERDPIFGWFLRRLAGPCTSEENP